MTAAAQGQPFVIRGSWTRTAVVWFGAALALAIMFARDAPAVLGGLPATLIGMSILWKGASSVGFHQGLGAVNRQFAATAIGAVVSLGLTAGLAHTDLVTRPLTFVAVQCALSYLPAIGPTLVAMRAVSKIGGRSAARGISPRFLAQVSDVVSVLPPALLTGLDGVALLVSGHSDKLAVYGIETRIALITTLVPGALYPWTRNVLANENEPSARSRAMRVSRLLLAMQIPLVAAFLAFSPALVSLLSSGKVSADPLLTWCLAALGFLVPLWVALSSGVLGSEAKRAVLGRVLLPVLLLGNATSFVLAFRVGVAGPVVGTCATYAAALVIAWRALRVETQDS